jgi:hypothetical protein
VDGDRRGVGSQRLVVPQLDLSQGATVLTGSHSIREPVILFWVRQPRSQPSAALGAVLLGGTMGSANDRAWQRRGWGNAGLAS